MVAIFRLDIMAFGNSYFPQGGRSNGLKMERNSTRTNLEENYRRYLLEEVPGQSNKCWLIQAPRYKYQLLIKSAVVAPLLVFSHVFYLLDPLSPRFHVIT